MKLIEFISDDRNCVVTDSENIGKVIDNKNFNMLQSNIRSIRRNFNHFCAFVQRSKIIFSIIVLNETHLEDGEEHLYHLDDYAMYHLNRNKFGGGQIIYCHNDFESSLYTELTALNKTIESIFINVKINKTDLFIGGIYRPPSSNLNIFTDEFETKILSKLPVKNSIILGDFNVDMLADVATNNLKFATSLDCRNYINHIDKPTREITTTTSSTSTLLDHIWSTFPVKKSFVCTYPLTDHFLVGCSLQIVPDKATSKIVSFRKVTPQKCNDFKNDFIDFKRSLTININTDIHTIFTYIILTLKILIDRHFPIIKRKRYAKQLKNPWIDDELMQFINKKNKIYKLYKQGKTNYSTFKRFRNLLTKSLSIAKRCYYIKHFKEVNTSPKESWKRVNKILKPHKIPKIKLKIMITL